MRTDPVAYGLFSSQERIEVSIFSSRNATVHTVHIARTAHRSLYIMAFQIGAKVIYLRHTGYRREQVIKDSTITKLNKRGDEMWVDHQHKPEDCLYSAFAYPDISECRELLVDIIAQSARHELENKDILTRQIQVSNEMVRRGLK